MLSLSVVIRLVVVKRVLSVVSDLAEVVTDRATGYPHHTHSGAYPIRDSAPSSALAANIMYSAWTFSSGKTRAPRGKAAIEGMHQKRERRIFREGVRPGASIRVFPSEMLS